MVDPKLTVKIVKIKLVDVIKAELKVDVDAKRTRESAHRLGSKRNNTRPIGKTYM